MKLSELSTDQALDVLCELTPYISNIANDLEVASAIGKVVVPGKPLSQYGHYTLIVGRISESIPLLIKNHRPDVYGILSVVNEQPVSEISAQNLTETVRQVVELVQDEDFATFFKSFAQQGQSAQSAPSASSPA